MTRVAILASGWSGYNDAACRELANRGVELLIIYEGASPDTAYTTQTAAEYAREYAWTGEAPSDFVEVVRDFAPDAVLMHSWHFKPYRAVMQSLPAGTLRVLWMDNIWRNTAKQWAGRAIAPWFVRSIFDSVMVPSDRTEFFARRLGFDSSEIIRGSLSADTDLFTAPLPDGADLASHRRFLACLRLVHHKGADVLAEAYRRYRSQCADPWELRVAGLGPMQSAYVDLEGAELVGYLQPTEIAAEMRAASCYINPAREEPYGVALHEAAVSGLPILSTDRVGAAPTFVQDGQNGWMIPSEDPAALADAMARMSAASSDRLGEMAAVSQHLGSRISSAGWARHLHEQIEARIAQLKA